MKKPSRRVFKAVVALALALGTGCVTPPDEERPAPREVRMAEVRASEQTVTETGIAAWHVVRRDRAMTVTKGFTATGEVAFEEEQVPFVRGGVKFTHFVVLRPAPYSITIGEDG